jgi:hypothetical protein
MAEAVAMRAMFTRLGFTAAASTAIVDDQGIDTIEEVRFLTDEEAEGLCRVVRKPGGTIPNPNAGAAGQPAEIPNPGNAVSKRAENNLKLACFLLRHRTRISRPIDAAGVTLALVRAMRDLKQVEDDHEDPHPPDNLINEKDWPKTIDGLQEYLRSCLGVTKIPLAYVIRDTMIPPAAAVDVATNYATPQDEMIARAPIRNAGDDAFTAHYLTDRESVWDKISGLTRDHACWTYVKPAQRARDGRDAYLRLFDHYLGPNNANNLASAAEAKLRKTSYTSERKRWNFERYVNTQKEQHNILEGLTQYGYSGIDEGTKVRVLLEGIKIDKLDSVKTQIMSNPALQRDFDRCVTLFSDFIKQTESSIREANISSVIRTNKRVKFDDVRVEDRYYKKSEYAKLSNEQKLKLKQLRESRGHEPPKKKTKVDDGNRLSKIERQIAEVLVKLDTTDEDKSKNDEQENGLKSNANHPALTRKSRG